MDMKRVYLVEREKVEIRLDVLEREEVARDVEHRPAPGEARIIVNRAPWKRPCRRRAVALDGHGEQLTKRLDAVEDACRCACRDPHFVRGDREIVALVTELARVAPEGERDRAAARARRARRDDRYREARRL